MRRADRVRLAPILARRCRTRGEIDIVARDGETTVFAEVRVKTSAEFGTAAESVRVIPNAFAS